MDPIVLPTAEVIRFGIVLCRTAGIMVFAPLFGSGAIPYQIRILFALVSTFVLAPSLPLRNLPADFGLPSLLGFVAGELLIGLVLGLASYFVFAGLQLAGQVMSFQLGFSIINVIDPQTQVETSVISFLENFIGVAFFLLINGHHWFFSAVTESFAYLPVTGLRLTGPVVQEFVRLAAGILVSGVQIAAPVIAVTVIADVVLGIIARVAPQIHIMIVAMPLKTLIGFTCMSLSFYFLPQVLGDRFMLLYKEMFALIHRLA
jgi:flagellar biosynthetic protein FliR